MQLLTCMNLSNQTKLKYWRTLEQQLLTNKNPLSFIGFVPVGLTDVQFIFQHVHL